MAGGGGTAATTGEGAIDLDGAPEYFRVLRLTNSQWGASVREVLGLPDVSPLEAALPSPILGLSDFSNNERLLDIDSLYWEAYLAASEALAAEVTASEAKLDAVYPGRDASGFIEAVGRRAYRRPLTAEEVQVLQGVFDVGKATSGSNSEFAKGAALVLCTLLQSPYFLYRTELGEAGQPLSGYEAAAKLSLWLRGATPNDALLDIADTLTSADAIGAAAQRMLDDDAARSVVGQFYDEHLHLSRLDQLSKVGVPGYDASLNAEYRESSRLFFDAIFSRDEGLREALTSTRGFVGPGMARLYGLADVPSGFGEAELGERRAGYFSQLPYLTLYSLSEGPDSIRRGLGLALDVLCAKLGPLALEVPPVPSPTDGQTNRERVTQLTGSCGGSCHLELMNPLGFAFEHFDGMGLYRDRESSGAPIDSSGTVRIDGQEQDFVDNASALELIAASEQAHLCFAKKVAGYGLQRDVVVADLPLLGQLASSSRGEGSSLKRLMRELAASDAFRIRTGASP